MKTIAKILIIFGGISFWILLGLTPYVILTNYNAMNLLWNNNFNAVVIFARIIGLVWSTTIAMSLWNLIEKIWKLI